MALRKPSDFFVQTESKSSNENIVLEKDDTLYDDLSKVESLSEQLSQLQQELTQKVIKTDLETLVLSEINRMRENFETLQDELNESNQNDINKFSKRIIKITEIVNNLVETEIPKYKKKITKNELLVKEKVNQFQQSVEQSINEIREEIGDKFNDIADVVDNNIEFFNQQLFETSSQVKKTTEIYTNLSKIVESRISKENEQLNEYSKIIENIQTGFVELQQSLNERVLLQQNTIEEKFENLEIQNQESFSKYQRQFGNIQSDIGRSIDSFAENYRKDIADVKTDVLINEKHIKNVDKYLQEYHQDLIELREEIFGEIENLPFGNLQENLERLEKKIDYIKETYSKIEPEVIIKEVISEGALNEPPEIKNGDPLTPLNQNFVTLEQLQQHYRLFLNRIQQQLSTLGGGGETRLKYLDDIVGISTNPSAYDGKYLRYNDSIGKFEFKDIVVAVSEENIIYVAKDGNDLNPGTLSEPKLTIKAAVEQATAETVIRIAPGTYIEDNPITLSDQITLIGHSLRETTVIPLNDNQDLFYVGNGNYIAEMSFKGSLNGKAVLAFDPTNKRYINQSPYVQNCTNFIPNSIGMKIDGRDVIGPLKSMVLDSYTQYNQGGIGVSITNEAYAQLVSLFTICNDTAVYCGSGGACDLTNSNSSFGNYGLVADGVSNKKIAGIVTVTSAENSDTFVVKFDAPTLNVTAATYDNVTGLATISVNSPHNFNVGMGISISGLEFTCSSGPGIVTYPSGNNGYIFNVSGVPSSNTFEVYVGVSTLSHTYVSGGTVNLNVVRPYDGQVVYFNELFYTVKTLNIVNGGSGYTDLPKITIDPPTLPWGVPAQAVPIIENGELIGVDMISNGRGYTTIPNVIISSGINTAVAIAELVPEYYSIQKATEIVGGISIITLNENVPFNVGVGTVVNFFKQSKILASGHSFEFIGSGTDISTCLPFVGGVPIDENETDSRNGGLVVYTSTNQAGNFKIGDGVTINQTTGSITGNAYTKSLLSTITPYILSLGGF